MVENDKGLTILVDDTLVRLPSSPHVRCRRTSSTLSLVVQRVSVGVLQPTVEDLVEVDGRGASDRVELPSLHARNPSVVQAEA